MNAGREKYENISIPEGLGAAIDSGMRRASRRRVLRAVRRTAAGAAAAVCILFAGANIMPVYSYAADIPVLGDIVRVFHVGSGGEFTDGAHAQGDAMDGKVEISFSTSDGALTGAPAYSVEHLYAPSRIVLNLHGVRGADFDSIRESFLKSEAVSDVYRNMYLDDSAISLTVVLNDGWDYEISEYAEPGTLIFGFTEAEQSEDEVYFLRSEAMPYGEQLGLMCEQYHAEGASQVKTVDGEYIVVIGQYASEEEALTALEALNSQHGDTGLYVASGEANEVPEA